MSRITDAVDRVREAVNEASRGLSPEDYRAFLEELLADAEGWKMRLDEEGE